MQNYSVLMAVYGGENPEYFNEAIQSMIDQSIRTNDFVIVCDGELTSELEHVISDYLANFNDLFNIVRLKENHGIGFASNIGVLHCENELIAKMDSDDISYIDRCEKEFLCFEKDSDLAVVGTYIIEFNDNDPNKKIIRKVPTDSIAIKKYSKRRSPFNNPTIMFRKSVVLAVGNYKGLRRGEDFEIFTRILHAGYKTSNIPDCLVKYRITNNTYIRRNDYSEIIKAYKMSKSLGHMNNVDYLLLCILRIILSNIPWKIKRWFYEEIIRKI